MKYGMVIDLRRCIGCNACTVACKQQYGNPPGIFYSHVNITEVGKYPNARITPLPVLCNHCDNPPCVDVCPTGASAKLSNGIVTIDENKCIGCRYCMVACPYARRYFNWSEPGWQDQVASLNPDVAPRPRGVVEKCTLCHHRIRAALERARLDEEPLTDETLHRLPACAQSCPTRAITFGDLADPTSEVAHLAASPRAMRLLPEAGTRPKVIYLRESK